jgi:AsmA protein
MVAVAALVVATGTFLLVAAPTDLVREHLVSQLRERTGRDVSITGRTSLRLFPDVGVAIDGVAVSAPPELGGEPVVRIAAVEAKVPLWPLLKGDVHIERLVLRRPELQLKVDRNGRRNWESAQSLLPPHPVRILRAQLAGATPVTRNRLDLHAVRLGDVRIEDGAARYIDEQRGYQEEIRGLNVQFALASPSEPMEASGDFLWRDERMEFRATLDSPGALFSGTGSPLRVHLAGRPAEAAYEGFISGTGSDLAGTLSLKANSLRELAAWFGRALPEGEGRGPAALSGKLRTGFGVVELTDAELQLDGTAARGSASLLATPGARPRLRAGLQLSQLDFNRWLPLGEPKGRDRPSKRGTLQDGGPGPTLTIDDLLKQEGGDQPVRKGGVKPQVRGFISRHGWSDVEFDMSALRRVDVDLTLSAGQLLYRNARTGPTRITAALDNGVLKASFQDMQLYEGTGHGTVTVDATGTDSAFKADLQFDHVTALELLRDAAEFDWISGKGRVHVSIEGRGRSERQIVETLTGKVEFAFRDGALIGYNIPHIIRALQQGRISGLERNLSEQTEFSELFATFRIDRGIAENRDFRLVSPQLRVTGAGTADLPNRTLDYAVRPKLAAAPGQGGAVALPAWELPVRVTGSWDRPSIRPDIDAVLKDPSQAVEAAKEVGKQLKNKNVDEVLRGLLGNGEGEAEGAAKPKARDLLRQLLRP